MVVELEKTDFDWFVEWSHQLFYNVLTISVTQCIYIYFLNSKMYGSSRGRGRFMKTFFLRLFATLLKNHRDSIVSVGLSASLLW